MKDRLRIWPMKALAALALFSGVFPVPVLLGRWLVPDHVLFWWFPFLMAYLWGIYGFLMPQKSRVLWTVLGCILVACAIFFSFGLRAAPLAVPCVILLILLPPAWAKPIWEEWTPAFWFIGVGLHLFGQVLASRPLFSGTQGLLMAVFLMYAFLMLMYLNRGGIREGMHGTGKAPASLRYRNTILVVGFFLIAAAASAWSTLAQWLDTAWYYLRLGIGRIVWFFMQLFPEMGPAFGNSSGGSGDFGSLDEASEASAFALFMEKVFSIMAMVFLAFLLFLAFRIIIRKLRLLWKKVMKHLSMYAAAVNEDYVDEAESTLNWDEKTQSVRDRVKETIQRNRKQPKWDELNGRARVRRLYQQYIRHKPEALGLTVREVMRQDERLSSSISGAFADLYERARYSDHDVSVPEADNMRRQL